MVSVIKVLINKNDVNAMLRNMIQCSGNLSLYFCSQFTCQDIYKIALKERKKEVDGSDDLR